MKAAQFSFLLLSLMSGLLFSFQNGKGDHSSVTVTSSYATHDVGNVALTVTSFGCLGYLDYAEGGTGEHVGEGFQYPIGSPNVLHHGSLLVAQNIGQVSDCCYGNSEHNRYDWVTAEGGDVAMSENISDMDVVARYNDSNSENPIGVSVTQSSYSWADAADDDYVIIEYEVENSSESFLSGIYIGLYMDWDIGEVVDNETDYDRQTKCGYFWNETSKYYGICLLSPDEPTSYRAVYNKEYVFPENSDLWFSEENKFLFMTEGIRVTESYFPEDWSQLMSVGPYDLEEGEKVKVAFAVLGGEYWDNIIQSTNRARVKYGTIIAMNHKSTSGQTPDRISLFQNYPNPFNPYTAIEYHLHRNSRITLTVYNMMGQKVKTLVNEKQPAGFYLTRWDGRDKNGALVPSGVYLYVLKADKFVAHKKMLLLK